MQNAGTAVGVGGARTEGQVWYESVPRGSGRGRRLCEAGEVKKGLPEAGLLRGGDNYCSDSSVSGRGVGSGFLLKREISYISFFLTGRRILSPLIEIFSAR